MVIYLDSFGPEHERGCSIELGKYSENQEMNPICRGKLRSKDQGTKYKCQVQRDKNAASNKSQGKVRSQDGNRPT